MRVIVIGCGRVGSGLAHHLALEGHSVTVVDSDPAAFDRLPAGFSGEQIVGFGIDRKVLSTAGIERTEALAAVTGNDEVNSVVARAAVVRFRVPRVVARMYDPRQADLYRRLGVVTISPVVWGIGRLSEALQARDVATVFSLGGGQVDLNQVTVPARLDGRPCRELEVPGELAVTAVSRGGRTFIPDGNSPMHTGDIVYLVVATGAASRLEELIGE